MIDFLEVDEAKKTLKSLNLEDFSVEDLNQYIDELNEELKKVLKEAEKKSKIKSEAQKFFK